MGLHPVALHDDGMPLGWAVFSPTTGLIESHFVFETLEEANEYMAFSAEMSGASCDETDKAWEREAAERTSDVGTTG